MKREIERGKTGRVGGEEGKAGWHERTSKGMINAEQIINSQPCVCPVLRQVIRECFSDSFREVRTHVQSGMENILSPL